MLQRNTGYYILFISISFFFGFISLKGQSKVSTASDTIISIGYDTVRVRNLSGSVSVINGTELTSIPGDNIGNLLQGRAAGLDVIGSGMPGSSARVRIRGFSSLYSGEPLWIVDGTPTTDISFLNPFDIDHVSILKDAAFGSLYGARSGGGVIAISTKKGKQGLSISYRMSSGFQLPGKGTKDELLDTREYADLQWLVYKNDGTSEINPIYGPSSNPAPQIPAWAGNTDWYKAITRPALLTDHSLSVTGGANNAKFYAGLGYFGQDGVIKYTYLRRYTGRLNSEFNLLKGRVTFGENFSFVYGTGMSVPNLSFGSPISAGPYGSQPIIPVVITQPVSGISHNFVPGEWGGTGIAPRLGNGLNQVAELTRDKNNVQDQQIFAGNVYLDLKIFEGLNIRTTWGGSKSDLTGKDYAYASYEGVMNRSWTTLRRTGTENKEKIWTTYISFNRLFGKHAVSAMAGYEASRMFGGYYWSAARVLPDNSPLDSSYYWTSGIPERSVFGMISYGFDNRYLINISLREDRLSQFGSSVYRTFYPSVSAVWIVTKEKFMKNPGWLSILKIRGSYGINGKGVLNLFSSDILINPGLVPEKLYNYNVGVDLGILENKVQISADGYIKHGYNMDYIAIVPSGNNFIRKVLLSTAGLKEHGFDIQVAYSDRWKEVNFFSKLIISSFKSTISAVIPGMTDFFDSSTDSYIGTPVRNQTGHSPSSFYGYKVTGLFQSAGEVASAPPQDGAAPGFFRYQDTNRDGFISPDDRTFIGDPNPAFTYSLSLGLSWKAFDLSAFFYGSEGNDIFNMNRWFTDFWPSFQGQKSKRLLYDSWTPERNSTSVPKASNTSNFSTNTQLTSYYIEDGSYLRLKSVEIGFTFPGSLTRRIHLNNLRVYLQAVNLFTLTKYSGLDPEIGGSDYSFGVDSGNYPNVKQILFGVSVTI